MADENNLINNKFIDTNVYNIYNNPNKYLQEQAEFRKFMEDKNIDLGDINHPTTSSNVANILDQSESIIDAISSEKPIINDSTLITKNLNLNNQQDLLRTNSSRYGTESNEGNNLLSVKIQEQQAKSTDRFVQEIRTSINIDSRDRDVTLYPDQNSYKINLGKKIFTNVISVKLKSTEFINTLQLIKETPVSQRNNLIFWEIDGDVNDSAANVVYDAALTAGNYNETTLATEIENQMNAVLRNNGKLNNFSVSIDSITDEVQFTSVEFTTFSNPFSFEIAGTADVNTAIESDFNDFSGVTVGSRIQIENATATGGIPASLLNGVHVLTGVTETSSKIEFTVPALATSTESGVGGSSVRIGTGVQFQLLWGEDNTPATILGFDEEDTGFGLVITNTKEIFKYDFGVTTAPDSDRLKINTITPGDSTNISLIRTTLPHLLQTGDRIFIFDDNNVPTDSTIVTYNHLYTIDETDISTSENESRKTYVGLLADPAGLIITRKDTNTFTVPIPYVNYTTLLGGNPTIADIIDSDVSDTDEYGDIIIKQINSAIDLTGERYIYITSPQLGNMLTTSAVDDIFYKLQMAGGANASIFNSYIGGGKIYYDVPLSLLDEVKFEFRTADNELMEFNDKDHSFTLEITEGIQKLEGIGFSERIGART
jgi:hypothetical protein